MKKTSRHPTVLALAAIFSFLFINADLSAYLDTYVPPKVHVVSKIAVDNSSLEIEDGSLWTLPSGCESKVADWTPGDLLELYLNNDCLRSSRFYFYNKRTSSHAPVNLNLGPLIDCPHTKTVLEIDPEARRVLITDGERHTVWRVPPGEAHNLFTWQVGDAIIVGLAPSWFSTYDCFLINIEENQFVSAREE